MGAFLGGFLAEGLNLDVWWQVLIVQVVVAAILVFFVNGAIRGQMSKHGQKSH